MLRITTLFLVLYTAATAQVGRDETPEPTVKPLEKIARPAKSEVDDDELRKKVDTLVEQLGSETFRDREDAYARLEKLGPAAIPHLERHVKHADSETRVRVRALLEALRKPRDLELPPEDGDPFDGLEPRRPGGIRIRPLRPRGQGGVLDDVWKEMDRLFEDGGQGQGLLGSDMMRRHREMMERLQRDFDSMSRGGMTLRLGPGGASFSSSTGLSFGDEQLTWTTTDGGVRLDSRGPAGERSWSASDLDAFKDEHPDVYERYKASGIFERTTFNITVPGLQPNDPLRPRRRPRIDLRGNLIEEIEKLLGEAFGGGNGGRLLEPPPMAAPGAARPRLGVVVTRLPADVAARYDAKEMGAEGLWVVEVTRGGLAEKMGLRAGDVIVGIGDRAMDSPAALREAVRRAGPGAQLRVRVFRDGELETLTGTLAGEPEREARPEPKPEPRRVRRIQPDRTKPRKGKKL